MQDADSLGMLQEQELPALRKDILDGNKGQRSACALAQRRAAILSGNGRVLLSQPNFAAFIKGLCLPGWQR